MLPPPPPGPVKISHKKMATEGGRIDFMFLEPLYPAAGSATGYSDKFKTSNYNNSSVLQKKTSSPSNCDLWNHEQLNIHKRQHLVTFQKKMKTKLKSFLGFDNRFIRVFPIEFIESKESIGSVGNYFLSRITSHNGWGQMWTFVTRSDLYMQYSFLRHW